MIVAENLLAYNPNLENMTYACQKTTKKKTTKKQKVVLGVVIELELKALFLVLRLTSFFHA